MTRPGYDMSGNPLAGPTFKWMRDGFDLSSFMDLSILKDVAHTGACVFCLQPTTTTVIPLMDFDFDETDDRQAIQLGSVVACASCWRDTIYKTISKVVGSVVEGRKDFTGDDQKLLVQQVMEEFLRAEEDSR